MSLAILYVLIKCVAGKERRILKQLRKLPAVFRANIIVTGEYDIIVQLKGYSPTEIKIVLITQLRRIPDIDRTISLPVIEAKANTC